MAEFDTGFFPDQCQKIGDHTLVHALYGDPFVGSEVAVDTGNYRFVPGQPLLLFFAEIKRGGAADG